MTTKRQRRAPAWPGGALSGLPSGTTCRIRRSMEIMQMSTIEIKLPPELYKPDGKMTDKTIKLVEAHMNMFPAGPCCRSDNRKLNLDSRIMAATYSSGTLVKNGQTSLLFDSTSYRLFISTFCTNCGLTWFYDLNAVIALDNN